MQAFAARSKPKDDWLAEGAALAQSDDRREPIWPRAAKCLLRTQPAEQVRSSNRPIDEKLSMDLLDAQ